MLIFLNVKFHNLHKFHFFPSLIW